METGIHGATVARGRSLVMSCTWLCLLSVSNALSTAFFFLVFRKSKDLYLIITQKLIIWNPADFMKSGGFHPWNPADFMKSVKSGRFQVKSSGFHEIHETQRISWNLADFRWNPPKIIKASVSAKTLQFDEGRVGDFTLEIQWISPWNLVDFTCEIWWISPRFHLWNPPKIIKASVSAKTLQFDECRVGDFTLEIQWISP